MATVAIAPVDPSTSFIEKAKSAYIKQRDAALDKIIKKFPKARIVSNGITMTASACDQATDQPIISDAFCQLVTTKGEAHGCFSDPHIAFCAVANKISLIMDKKSTYEEHVNLRTKFEQKEFTEDDLQKCWEARWIQYLPLEWQKCVQVMVHFSEIEHGVDGTIPFNTWNEDRWKQLKTKGITTRDWSVIRGTHPKIVASVETILEESKKKPLPMENKSPAAQFCAHCKTQLVKGDILKYNPQTGPDPEQNKRNGSKGKRKAVEQGGEPVKKERSV